MATSTCRPASSRQKNLTRPDRTMLKTSSLSPSLTSMAFFGNRRTANRGATAFSSSGDSPARRVDPARSAAVAVDICRAVLLTRYPVERATLLMAKACICVRPSFGVRASCRLFQRRLPLRNVHDHAGSEVQTRLDRLDQNVFRIDRVGAEAAQAEALDHRSLRLERSEGGIGPAAGRLVEDAQLHAELAVDLLTVGGERPRGGGWLQGREAPLEDELHLAFGQQLVLDPLAQLLLDAVVIDDALDAYVRLRLRAGWNHIADDAGVRHRPVDLQSDRRVREITHLQHLVRHLVERVDTPFRSASCV